METTGACRWVVSLRFLNFRQQIARGLLFFEGNHANNAVSIRKIGRRWKGRPSTGWRWNRSGSQVLVSRQMSNAIIVVEPDQGNGQSECIWTGLRKGQMYWMKMVPTVLSHIISQLRPGADLSKVTLPTFILEPKSMLERITKYVAWIAQGTRLWRSPTASWHTPKSFFPYPRLTIRYNASFRWLNFT